MKSALFKNIWREITGTMSRFLSIFTIVALGVSFFAGIRATSPDMKIVGDTYLDKQNFHDISILSTTGFSDMDIRDIMEINGVKKVVADYNVDALAEYGEGEMAIKIHSLSNKYNEEDMDKPVLQEGRLPKRQYECVVEPFFLEMTGYKIGDIVPIKTGNAAMKFTITGTIVSPIYLERFNRGSNSLGNGETQAYVQIMESAAAELATPKIELPYGFTMSQVFTEILVQVEGAEDLNCFDDDYETLVKAVTDDIEDLAEDKEPTEWFVLDREKNFSFVGYSNDILRIKAIGTVFPMLFFVVAALISLTTMTRMVEEQRIQIGTLKALGYSKFEILLQYFIYSLAASIGGSAVGILVGFNLFPTLIYTAYQILYMMPKMVPAFHMDLAISSTALAVLCTTSAAVISCIGELVAVPAVLMRPKAPKSGKRIFLENIDFIWRRLAFTSKVTARNLLRYKKRFFMSVIGIAGCTALLLTGYGLKNSIIEMSKRQFNTVFLYDLVGYVKQPVGEGEAKYFSKELTTYDNITKAIMCYEQNADMKKSGTESNTVEAYLVVPQNEKDFTRYVNLKEGKNPLAISDNGVLVTEKFAKLIGARVGDEIEIKIDDEIVKAKISGLTENYLMHYVYMSKDYYETLYKKAVEYNQFMGVIFGETVDEDTMAKDLMKNSKINSVSFTRSSSDKLNNTMKSIDYVVVVMIISAAALAFVVMYNLTNININERIRELATIKVLGFYDGEVGAYVYRENIILSIVGTGVGLLLGIVAHRFVLQSAEIDMIMFVKEINSASFIYSAVLTLAFAGIVNIVMYKKLKDIDMVASLKMME